MTCHPDCGPITAIGDGNHKHVNEDGDCWHADEEDTPKPVLEFEPAIIVLGLMEFGWESDMLSEDPQYPNTVVRTGNVGDDAFVVEFADGRVFEFSGYELDNWPGRV